MFGSTHYHREAQFPKYMYAAPNRALHTIKARRHEYQATTCNISKIVHL